MIGAFPLDTVAGLTQDQIRARLGLKPREGLGASGSVALSETGEVIAIADIARDYADLSGVGACPKSQRGFRSILKVEPYLRLRFVDGKAVAIEGEGGGDLVATCVQLPKAKRGGGLDMGQAAMLPLTLLTAPVWVGYNAYANARQDQALDRISELRLGQQPPGLFEGWIQQQAAAVEIISRNGGDAEVLFDLAIGREAENMARIRFRQQRVVSIEMPRNFVCTLSNDRSYSCVDWRRRR